MTRRAIVPLILLGLVALGVYWFFTTHERVPGKERVGMSGEARLKPFLAAERFAQRMGVRVREVRSLPEIDALAAQKTRGMLLLPNRRQGLEESRLSSILAWVGAGGHLVVEAELPGVDDPLLERLEVTRALGKPAPADTALAVELNGRKYSVAFRDAATLDAPPESTLASAGGKLRVLAHGKGVVTAVTSLGFARNAMIGERDHAAFLWALLEVRPGEELLVYFRPERLSLSGFLAENAMPALIAAALLLLAWLWHIAPRFGPVTPDAPPARRRLLDHLRACGRFYWANNLRSRLVLAARDAALRRIARAQPDFADAPQAGKVSKLVGLIHVSDQEALRFLGAAGQMRGADFIRVTQHAQRIHSALEKGDR